MKNNEEEETMTQLKEKNCSESLSFNVSTLTEQFKECLDNNDFYNLLVKVKVVIRKELKKNSYNNFCEVVNFALGILSKNNEVNSCFDIAGIFFTETEKFFNQNKEKFNKNEDNFKINLLDKYISSSDILFKCVPMDNNINASAKLSFMQKFTIQAELMNVNPTVIEEFYEKFSLDCFKNKQYSTGYRLGIKSGNVSIIQIIFNNYILKNINDGESDFALARVGFELLINKKNKSAYQFIGQNIDVRNFKENSPLLNFTFFIIEYISKNLGYVKFKELVFNYEKAWKIDPEFSKYLDKISLVHFNKKITTEKVNFGQFDLTKLIKSFSK